MHKAGNRVFATVPEIFAMKEDEKLFAKFVGLSRAWIEAEAFKLARRTRADVSEARTWLAAGLWDAVRRADDRLQGVGGIFDLAVRYSTKAYVAQYVNVAQKTEDACDSCNRGDDGEFEEIQIPDLDEDHASFAFRDFMENLRTLVTERDFLVIQKRLDGDTLEEIGASIGISKQGVDKIFKKHLPKLRAFA
jgi:hypothetical protein